MTNRFALQVQSGIYDNFLDTIVNYVSKSAKVGDGFHPETTIGPVINQKALDKVLMANLFQKVEFIVRLCII